MICRFHVYILFLGLIVSCQNHSPLKCLNINSRQIGHNWGAQGQSLGSYLHRQQSCPIDKPKFEEAYNEGRIQFCLHPNIEQKNSSQVKESELLSFCPLHLKALFFKNYTKVKTQTLQDTLDKTKKHILRAQDRLARAEQNFSQTHSGDGLYLRGQRDLIFSYKEDLKKLQLHKSKLEEQLKKYKSLKVNASFTAQPKF